MSERLTYRRKRYYRPYAWRLGIVFIPSWGWIKVTMGRTCWMLWWSGPPPDRGRHTMTLLTSEST